jgi:GNAT superfamily N-acetyltransferase
MNKPERRILRASAEDAATAVGILQEVSSWLERRGRSLWDPAAFLVADFERAASAEELVLGYEGAKAVACMLLQRSDSLHWPNDRAGEALYVHKLAVRRCAAGRNWSAHLIEWAKVQARSNRASFLRLDTDPRPELVSLYERHGFTLIDEKPRSVGTFLVVRLEMRVADDSHAE